MGCIPNPPGQSVLQSAAVNMSSTSDAQHALEKKHQQELKVWFRFNQVIVILLVFYPDPVSALEIGLESQNR